MKKGCLLLFLLGWMTTVSAQFLHEGDTIAIISPSSAMNKDALYGGIRTLESWGYRCVVGKNALNDYHGFAGTIDERLHPKLIIGFSDITALLCAEARAGVKGIHGTMCHALITYEGNDTVSQCLRRMLQGDLPEYHVAPHPLNVEGRAEGIVVGGNLSVYNDLAGSDYDPLLLPGIILVMEDTGEEMSKVDRMLHNMEMRGLLPNVRGIIVGQFNEYKHPENGFDDMYAMLHEYLRHYTPLLKHLSRKIA